MSIAVIANSTSWSNEADEMELVFGLISWILEMEEVLLGEKKQP